MLDSYYALVDNMTYIKDIKLVSFNDENFTDCFVTIVSDSDRLDITGLLKPRDLDDIYSVLED